MIEVKANLGIKIRSVSIKKEKKNKIKPKYIEGRPGT